jgi:hypothetical protein
MLRRRPAAFIFLLMVGWWKNGIPSGAMGRDVLAGLFFSCRKEETNLTGSKPPQGRSAIARPQSVDDQGRLDLNPTAN